MEKILNSGLARLYLITILVLFSFSNVFAYTMVEEHPRIWFTTSDLSAMRARMGSGGTQEIPFNTIATWCDSHIGDSLSADTDFDEHLYKFAAAHILDPEGDDTIYGDRVVAILNHMADNAQGWGNYYDEDSDRSGIDGFWWWTPNTAVAVAYDWAYDRIKGSAHESDIEAYMYAMIESDACSGSYSGSGCGSYQAWSSTWHKTEENWGWIITALALYGEQDPAANDNIAGVLDFAEEFLVEASDDWTGSYVRTHNYVREDGYFLHVNGYEDDVASSLTYVIAWHTATTDDLTEWPWWCNNARGALALLPPDGQYPKIGEVQPYGTTSSLSDSARGTQTVFYLGGANICGPMDSTAYYDALIDINSERASDDWADLAMLIWKTGSEDYTNLDRAYHFNRNGGFAFRSGWNFGSSSNDLVGEIRGFKPYKNDHWAAHSGHFDYRRGDDYLLIAGGAYTGGHWDDDSSDEYCQDSDSANTVHIGDTDHRSRADGVSNAGTSMTEDEYGQTIRFQYVDGDYAYGLYDMTKAFKTEDVSHSSGAVYRSLVFLDDKYVFIHDYIHKVSSSDSVRIFWHMQPEPADDGSGWTDSGQSASATGRTSTDASVFWLTRGDSQAWIRVVEPATGVSFTKYGGSWDTCFVDVDGTSHTVPQYAYDNYGLWRVDTEIPDPGTTELDFLHVIQAKSSSSSESLVTRLTSAGYIGAYIADTTSVAAMFSEDGTDQTSCGFSVEGNSGALKAVVANLEAGTYSITQDGNSIGSYVVDSEGVLFFSADLSDGQDFVVSTSSSNCPNSQCEPQYGEDCTTCPADCGTCPACGDGTCDASEDCTTCEVDCGTCQCTPIHDADNNPCDGVVSTEELSAYINEWKAGTVNIQDLMGAIVAWKE